MAKPGQRAAGATVLLIEDGRTYRELAVMLLESVGHSVVEASTAEEGLQLARESPPDVILMDTNLPGMDGFAAVRELKGDARTRHIPVVGLTAERVEAGAPRQRAEAAGFDDYIEKPVQKQAFRELIARFLP